MLKLNFKSHKHTLHQSFCFCFDLDVCFLQHFYPLSFLWASALKNKQKQTATDRDMLDTIKYTTSLFWLSFKADISSRLASSMLCYITTANWACTCKLFRKTTIWNHIFMKQNTGHKWEGRREEGWEGALCKTWNNFSTWATKEMNQK